MESGVCRIPPFPLLWNPLLLPYSTALIIKLQRKYSISCPSVMIPYPPLSSSQLGTLLTVSPKIAALSPSSSSSSMTISNESSSSSTPSPLFMKVKKDRDCHCEICGKTFGRHWLLQGHLRTHSEKPHLCSRCGKRFALKSYLSKHEESACYRSSSTTTSTGKSATFSPRTSRLLK
ncbi:hypothetical protein Angca_007547 [Angiostrongylus cantonensis]|nr:hypothetical protein Angca_007547 [Angiostrongylus cantonensis]